MQCIRVCRITCAVGGWNATLSWPSPNTTQMTSKARWVHSYTQLPSPRPQANGFYGQSISVSGDGSNLAIASPGVTSTLVSQAHMIGALM
jgi:hypothetical protein